MGGPSGAELVELLREAYEAVDEVCSSLAPGDWDLPTDCPGWSIKDNLSHEAMAVTP